MTDQEHADAIHAARRDDWRCISTAPKDGTGVLAYDSEYPGEVVAVCWSKLRGGWVFHGLSSVSLSDFHPTRWQYMPPPPRT